MSLTILSRFQKSSMGFIGVGTNSVMSRKSIVSVLQTRSFANVETNTPRQQPTPSRQRRTPVSFDTANLTIRVSLYSVPARNSADMLPERPRVQWEILRRKVLIRSFVRERSTTYKRVGATYRGKQCSQPRWSATPSHSRTLHTVGRCTSCWINFL